jgi:Fic family protein
MSAKIYTSQLSGRNQNNHGTLVSGVRKRIWNSPDWPRFKVDMEMLSPALSKARSTQGQLAGLLASLSLLDHTQIQAKGWVKEAQSTTLIEGDVLQLNSVRASVARRLGLINSNKRHDNATEGMLDILQSCLALANEHAPITEKNLNDWHGALFPTGRSGLIRIIVGQFRTHSEPMQIVTARLDGNDIVHYEAPPSSAVGQQMRTLLAWFDSSQSSSWPTDGLVRAAIAHLWFEAIHPYEDGNGRIGRALAELALFQDWKAMLETETIQRVYSLSHQLWLDRKGYYDQLQIVTSQENLHITGWVDWFIQCVTLAMQSAIRTVTEAVDKTKYWHQVTLAHPNIRDTQRKVLNKLCETSDGFKSGLSTELYCKISGCSRATAYRDLTEMLSLGLLNQTGVGRGTRYWLRGGHPHCSLKNS